MSANDQKLDDAVIGLADSTIARRAITSIVDQLRALPDSEKTEKAAQEIWQRVVLGEVAAFGERLKAKINETTKKLDDVLKNKPEAPCSST